MWWRSCIPTGKNRQRKQSLKEIEHGKRVYLYYDKCRFLYSECLADVEWWVFRDFDSLFFCQGDDFGDDGPFPWLKHIVIMISGIGVIVFLIIEIAVDVVVFVPVRLFPDLKQLGQAACSNLLFLVHRFLRFLII